MYDEEQVVIILRQGPQDAVCIGVHPSVVDHQNLLISTVPLHGDNMEELLETEDNREYYSIYRPVKAQTTQEFNNLKRFRNETGVRHSYADFVKYEKKSVFEEDDDE